MEQICLAKIKMDRTENVRGLYYKYITFAIDFLWCFMI